MVRALLIRGMLCGILAGLLVFGVARVFGEPQVDRAIAFETAMDNARIEADARRGRHDAPEPVLVSRPMQAGFGLLTGVMVYSIAFGGLFALVFAAVDRRLGRLGPRGMSALLAAAGFIAVSLVPGLKYPANPPSVGHPDTIGLRTGLYAVMMAVSVAAMLGAALLRRHLAPRHGTWTAALAAAAFYGLAVIATAAILAPVDEVPDGFPAELLWRFRIDSMAMQLVLWGTLGLGFGALAERARTGAWDTSRLAPTAWRIRHGGR